MTPARSFSRRLMFNSFHMVVSCARISLIATSLSAGMALLAEIDCAMCERSKPAVSRRFQARMRMLESRASSGSSRLVFESTAAQTFCDVVDSSDSATNRFFTVSASRAAFGCLIAASALLR